MLHLKTQQVVHVVRPVPASFLNLYHENKSVTSSSSDNNHFIQRGRGHAQFLNGSPTRSAIYEEYLIK